MMMVIDARELTTCSHTAAGQGRFFPDEGAATVRVLRCIVMKVVERRRHILLLLVSSSGTTTFLVLVHRIV